MAVDSPTSTAISSRSKFSRLFSSKLSKSHYPVKRAGHTTAVIRDTLYMWGGYTDGFPNVHNNEDKRKMTSTIDIFELYTGQWKALETQGQPPLGISGYACASIGNDLYYFGGDCQHDNCYHNSINKLDTQSFAWHEVSPTLTDGLNIPCRKAACHMVHIHDGEDLLLIVGGYGIYPNTPQSGSQYCVDQANGLFRTNEQHLYNTSTGKWISPVCSGQRPPPSNAFTLTSISHQRAIMFGGRVLNDGSSDIHICTITSSAQSIHWDKVIDPLTHVSWPVGRKGHSSGYFGSCGCGQGCVVILGGEDVDNDHVKDCWILDVNGLSWKQVSLPDDVTHRSFHSVSVFTFGPCSLWLVVTGGIDNQLIGGSQTIMIIEIVKGVAGDWVGNVVHQSSDEWMKSYQDKLFDVLKRGRTEYADMCENYKTQLVNIQHHHHSQDVG